MCSCFFFYGLWVSGLFRVLSSVLLLAGFLLLFIEAWKHFFIVNCNRFKLSSYGNDRNFHCFHLWLGVHAAQTSSWTKEDSAAEPGCRVAEHGSEQGTKLFIYVFLFKKLFYWILKILSMYIFILINVIYIGLLFEIDWIEQSLEIDCSKRAQWPKWLQWSKNLSFSLFIIIFIRSLFCAWN